MGRWGFQITRRQAKGYSDLHAFAQPDRSQSCFEVDVVPRSASKLRAMPTTDRVASAIADGGPAPPFSALLLAAGQSSRMGRDKALLLAGGEPLWRRQRHVLAATGAAELFLSARENQSWARAATAYFDAVVRDVEHDAGPLAGIVAAFDRATHGCLLVVAIDLPGVTPRYLQRLVFRAGSGRGVVPAWPDGRVEPLCAVYPRAAAALARQLLERRERRMQEFVAALEAAGLVAREPIAPAEAALFVNWNEPADMPSDIPP